MKKLAKTNSRPKPHFDVGPLVPLYEKSAFEYADEFEAYIKDMEEVEKSEARYWNASWEQNLRKGIGANWDKAKKDFEYDKGFFMLLLEHWEKAKNHFEERYNTENIKAPINILQTQGYLSALTVLEGKIDKCRRELEKLEHMVSGASERKKPSEAGSGDSASKPKPVSLEPLPEIHLTRYQDLSEELRRKYLARAGQLKGGRIAQVGWSLKIAPNFNDTERMYLIGMTRLRGRDGFSDLKKKFMQAGTGKISPRKKTPKPDRDR